MPRKFNPKRYKAVKAPGKLRESLRKAREFAQLYPITKKVGILA